MDDKSEHRIKSALEIGLEKAAKLGDLTQEEALELKWVPEGEKLAALYLKGEQDLPKSLGSLEREARPYALKGVLSVLLPRLTLPRHEGDQMTNTKVLQGLSALCKDKKALDQVLNGVKYTLDQYAGYGRQQLDQSYQTLRQQIATQVQQSLKQRGVTGPVQVDIESTPEFQSQWGATLAKLEQPYEQHLVDFRKQLRELILAKPAF